MEKVIKFSKPKEVVFDAVKFGADLIKFRVQNDWSVTDVCNETGLGRATVYNMECGNFTPNCKTAAILVTLTGERIEKYFVKK